MKPLNQEEKDTYASEENTVQEVTSGKKNGKRGMKRSGKACRAANRNESGAKKFDEEKEACTRKAKKQRAAGGKNELHVY